MPITVYTTLWGLIGLASLVCLFLFNSKPSIMAFVTKREYLLFFMLASLLGMRQIYPFACIIFALTTLFMLSQYPLYAQFCYRNKNQNKNQPIYKNQGHHKL